MTSFHDSRLVCSWLIAVCSPMLHVQQQFWKVCWLQKRLYHEASTLTSRNSSVGWPTSQGWYRVGCTLWLVGKLRIFGGFCFKFLVFLGGLHMFFLKGGNVNVANDGTEDWKVLEGNVTKEGTCGWICLWCYMWLEKNGLKVCFLCSLWCLNSKSAQPGGPSKINGFLWPCHCNKKNGGSCDVLLHNGPQPAFSPWKPCWWRGGLVSFWDPYNGLL